MTGVTSTPDPPPPPAPRHPGRDHGERAEGAGRAEGAEQGETAGQRRTTTGDGPSRAALQLPALRRHNDALALTLLRHAGPTGLSRAELATHTGLTPQAVSKIAARLKADGLAAPAATRASTGGKPPTALRLVPEAGHAVGIHLDRDELTAVLVDLTGTVVRDHQAPLDLTAGPDTVLTAATAAVRELRTGAVLGAGVAIPGPLDHRTGVLGPVTGAPALAGFPLRQALSAALALPVALDKDTNAGALGLTESARTFAYLHLGTGLGAGLALRGELYRGARTGAGEFGHQVVQLDGPPCDCGRRGCLEALCLEAVHRGDLPTAARLLGVGAANLVRLLDVDRFYLGGRTVLTAPDTFAAGVRAELGPDIPCEIAPGADRTVATGAAELVLAPLFDRTPGRAA